MAIPRTLWNFIRAGVLVAGALFGCIVISRAAVWQWSVPMEEGRAFLWIPENCERVRAVVVGQHNMIEQGILEHDTMRRTLAALGIAEVFIAPPFDRPFKFDQGAGERFDAMMHALADESGYAELASAPIVPIGHSACASFPWNFAAWNPGRTLAVLSVKGDAPETDLTGSGKPNPEWGTRNIDGVPGLMVMSEYEWWDARLTPALKFRAAHPAASIALLADVGHGHFDASDELVDFLALFIRKAAEARLPRGTDVPSVNSDTGRMPVPLKPVDPAHGWLVDRWRGDESLRAAAAPFASYKGDRAEAFWCFDEEMARTTEAYYATSRAKKVQQVDFVQNGGLAPISTTHTGLELKFIPQNDGITFRLGGDFITPLPPKPPVAAKDKPPPPTTIIPVRAAAGLHSAGPVRISRITGPVEQIAPDVFRVTFNQTLSTTDKRNYDVWLLASHPGDGEYKGAVQQALLKIGPNTEGVAQHIDFPAIPDQRRSAPTVTLAAKSDAGVPVHYYVREGPAEIEGDTLRLTTIPPRTKFPMKVTVVAWQLGRATEPKLRTAQPVERTFLITP